MSDLDPATALETVTARMYQRLVENNEMEGDGEVPTYLTKKNSILLIEACTSPKYHMFVSQVTAGAGRAQVVVLIMFSRVNTGDRQALNDAVYRIRR